MTRLKITQKLTKWYDRAEQALNRKQAQKALRKVKKWASRLQELDNQYR